MGGGSLLLQPAATPARLPRMGNLPPLKIDDLIDAFETLGDENSAFADRETGRVFTVWDDMKRAAEDEGDDEAVTHWSEAAMRQVREILADFKGKRYVPLPAKWDFHEFRHMERFIGTVESPAAAEELDRAIRGKGAFRYFKETAARHGLLDAWYKYRDDAIRRHLLDWAQVNNLTVDETPGRTSSVPPW